MLILTLRTDSPRAELHLFDDQQEVGAELWQAHRELSATVHRRLDALLKQYHKTLHDIQGLVCYKGPGSFTGLRIGFSVANALAYALQVPIVAAEGEIWQSDGIARLLAGENEVISLPEYGMPAHITEQKR